MGFEKKLGSGKNLLLGALTGGLVGAAVAAAFSFGACDKAEAERRFETWRMYASGEWATPSETGRDSLHFSLKESTFDVVYSPQSKGDTVYFAISRGLAYNSWTGRRTTLNTSSGDVAPGVGFRFPSGEYDSIYFGAGKLEFRGHGNDVFLEGTVEIPDTTFKSSEKSAEWRAAVIQSPASDLLRFMETFGKR